jgi:Ca-activated chloride channel family protein
VSGTGSGSLAMTVHLSDPVLASGGVRDEYLLADVVGSEATGQAQARAPMNIAVVLDCSGSMVGEKLDNARRTAHQLIDRLNEKDRLAFVTFGTTVSTIFPSALCTSDAKAEMHRAIDRIEQMGSTNISGGLMVGLNEVRAHNDQYPVNRIILISDGQANEGVTSKEGLVGISRQARTNGISVSSYGVGVDFDEDLMEQLAENGGGNYSFLRTGGDLEEVFNRELRQLSTQVASHPKLMLHLADGVRVNEVYGYAYENDSRGNTIVQLYDVPAGGRYRVMVHLSVPANSEGAQRIADLRLDYTDLLRDRQAASSEASLSAQVSGDATYAANQRDKAIYSQVVVGNAALASKNIASLYSSGQVEEAQRQLEEARTRMRRNVVDFAVQSVQGEVDRLLPTLPSSANSEAGRVTAITMHRSVVDFASQSTVH